MVAVALALESGPRGEAAGVAGNGDGREAMLACLRERLALVRAGMVAAASGSQEKRLLRLECVSLRSRIWQREHADRKRAYNRAYSRLMVRAEGRCSGVPLADLDAARLCAPRAPRTSDCRLVARCDGTLERRCPRCGGRVYGHDDGLCCWNCGTVFYA